MTTESQYITLDILEKVLDKHFEKFAIMVQAGFADFESRFNKKLEEFREENTREHNKIHAQLFNLTARVKDIEDSI